MFFLVRAVWHPWMLNDSKSYEIVGIFDRFEEAEAALESAVKISPPVESKHFVCTALAVRNFIPEYSFSHEAISECVL